MKKLMGRALKITELEVSRLLPAALSYCLLMAGIILGRNARDSLFLRQVGLTWLPYMYIANAVFVVVGASVCGFFIDRMNRTRFVALTLFVFALSSLVMRVLAAPEKPPLTMLCYIIVQIIWVVGLLLFWTLCGDLFDPREAKRVFPLIGAGGLIGMVVAGFGGQPVVKLIGTENLYLVLAGLLFASALVIFFHMRCPPSQPAARRPHAPEEHEPKRGFKQQFKEVMENPLLRGLAGVTVVLWLVFTVLDYQFSLVAREAYKDKNALTAFLGMFRGAAGISCLLIQFALTPWLIARFGVGRTIAVHPAFVAVAAGVMSSWFGLITTCIGKFGDHVLLYTIQDTSYQMLYNAVPTDRRGRARSFIEGTIKPISMGIAGLVLVVFTRLMGPAKVSLVLFVCAIAWFLFAVTIRRSYVKALMDALVSTRPEDRLDSQTLRSLRGPETYNILASALRGGDETRAIAASEIIVSMEFSDALPLLREGLTSGPNSVRAACAAAIGALGERSDLSLVTSALSGPDPEVRVHAVEAVGSLGTEEDVYQLVPMLEDSELKVRTAAIAALIRMGGLDGILAAAKTLEAMLNSPDAKDRAEGATVLGKTRVHHFVPNLIKLVRDPDPEVRRHAVKALGKLADPRAVEPLIEFLSDHHVARRAMKGLIALGPVAVPGLGRALRESLSVDVRRRAAQVIAQAPCPEAVTALMADMNDPDPEARLHVLRGLEWCEERQVLPEDAKGELVQAIRQELLLAYRYRLAQERLAPLTSGVGRELFEEVLNEQESMAVDRVLTTMGALTNPRALREIRAQIGSGDARTRALALEALENLGQREIAASISPLLLIGGNEWVSVSQRLLSEEERQPAKLAEWLAAEPVPVTRATLACALGAAEEWRGIMDRLAQDEDVRVRESVESARGARPVEGGRVMLTTIEKILVLRSAPIFAGLHREDLPRLAGEAEQPVATAGTEIFHAGDPADALYVIVKGRIAIVVEAGGRERTVAVLGDLECFGEMSILDGRPRSSSARALEETTLLRIAQDDFLDLLRDRPEIAFAVFRVLTARLRHADETVLNMPVTA